MSRVVIKGHRPAPHSEPVVVYVNPDFAVAMGIRHLTDSWSA